LITTPNALRLLVKPSIPSSSADTIPPNMEKALLHTLRARISAGGAFTPEEREWCVSEAMVLTGFLKTPVELLREGEAVIARMRECYTADPAELQALGGRAAAQAGRFTWDRYGEGLVGALREMTDGFAGLVLTTGGTGFGPRDLTPEGTRSVVEREAPGIAEAIRRASDGDGRGFGMLSRGVAGSRGAALICNLPGSSSGAAEGFDVLAPIAAHALDLLAGGHPH